MLQVQEGEGTEGRYYVASCDLPAGQLLLEAPPTAAALSEAQVNRPSPPCTCPGAWPRWGIPTPNEPQAQTPRGHWGCARAARSPGAPPGHGADPRCPHADLAARGGAAKDALQLLLPPLRGGRVRGLPGRPLLRVVPRREGGGGGPARGGVRVLSEALQRGVGAPGRIHPVPPGGPAARPRAPRGRSGALGGL